ncbi:uncharacterized protein LOC134072982 [Sardina pilchardus]|uniref:uncharacterized protein LOC134072982 n=1 Tax=Sardina pilchardus TaxID=27697 RepID=UPI002E10A2E6
MGNNKLKNYYECMCIILLCSPLKAYHVSTLSSDVIIGSSTTLECLIEDSDASSFKNCFYLIWMRVNPKRRTLDVINVDRVKYTTENNDDKKSCKLIITTATPEDAGLYYCTAPDAKPFIGTGTKLIVVGRPNDDTPSVELFPPSEFLHPAIPLICWATNAPPSQVRIFWVINEKEHVGWTESVWSTQSDQNPEFTQSRFWLSKSDWDAGEKCTCVVEAGGRNISKSIQRAGNDICLYLVYGISCAAFFMMFVAVTTVLVLYKGNRVKEVGGKDHRRRISDKLGKYTTKGSSLTELQYASLDKIHFNQPQ